MMLTGSRFVGGNSGDLGSGSGNEIVRVQRLNPIYTDNFHFTDAFSLCAMFKKLKQKIEEGGEAGIDKVSFSPRKFPGAIVRSPPVEAPDFPAMGERGSEGGDGGDGDPGGLPPNETSVELTEATGEGEGVAVSCAVCVVLQVQPCSVTGAS